MSSWAARSSSETGSCLIPFWELSLIKLFSLFLAISFLCQRGTLSFKGITSSSFFSSTFPLEVWTVIKSCLKYISFKNSPYGFELCSFKRWNVLNGRRFHLRQFNFGIDASFFGKSKTYLFGFFHFPSESKNDENRDLLSTSQKSLLLFYFVNTSSDAQIDSQIQISQCAHALANKVAHRFAHLFIAGDKQQNRSETWWNSPIFPISSRTEWVDGRIWRTYDLSSSVLAEDARGLMCQALKNGRFHAVEVDASQCWAPRLDWPNAALAVFQASALGIHI